jgi:hypothetical protein
MHFAIVRLRQVEAYAIEYYNAIAHYLRDAGHDVSISTWEGLLDESDVILFFHTGFYGIPDDVNLRGKHIVLMNLEQLTRKNYLEFTKKMLEVNPQMLYADYSTANLDILEAEMGIRGMWIPYMPVPNMMGSTESRSTELIFYGCMSAERAAICRRYGATVLSAFMEERDDSIRKARCVLNCHYNKDYGVFESLRAYHAIYLGTPVFTADESLPEACFLSTNNQRYLLKTLPVPDDLPPLDFTEEYVRSRIVIHSLITLFHLS